MYIKHPSEHDRETGLHKPGDRRTIKRRHLIFYLRVWELNEDRPLGHVVDITPEGLMLISEEPMPVDQEYTLEVRLPDTEGALQPMRFRAVCRWSDNDINPTFFDSGFEFLDIHDEHIKTIRKLVEEYGFHD
jgi:hypothetical protein